MTSVYMLRSTSEPGIFLARLWGQHGTFGSTHLLKVFPPYTSVLLRPQQQCFQKQRTSSCSCCALPGMEAKYVHPTKTHVMGKRSKNMALTLKAPKLKHRIANHPTQVENGVYVSSTTPGAFIRLLFVTSLTRLLLL